MKKLKKANINNFSIDLLLIFFIFFAILFINFLNSTKLPNNEESVAGISIDNTGFLKQTIYLNNYYLATDPDYTQAILKANAKLKADGGGTLIFPAGNYKIKPSQIFIPSNVKWLGQGTARIYTQETSLYNVLISTENGAKNIEIDNLTFDQRNDVTQTPTVAGPVTGAFLLHISNTDNVIVRNSTFYTYGVCAILSQSNYTTPTNNIGIYSNKAYFQRKTDTFYDVSVFNIDGRNVYVENNYIEGIEVPAFKTWKPRTAYEVHMPNGIVNNNVSINTETGILPVNWPTLWTTYEPNFIGSLEIANNRIEKAIIGIDFWSGKSTFNTTTRNITVKGNNINLHLDSKYVPAYGIGLIDGDGNNGIFDNILIDNNTITMTVNPLITNVNTRMNYMIPGQSVGAMLMNTKSTIKNLIISNNTVTNFPFSFLNLYRRNDTGNSFVHDNVKVFNNTVTDCAYVTTYLNGFEAIYNAGKANNVSIYGNTVTNPTRKAIALLNKLDALTNFVYSDTAITSTIIPTTKPTAIPTPISSTTRIYTGVIGTWANSKQIYVTNRDQCLIGDMIITPNGEKSIIRNSVGNYIYLVTDVATWYGGKDISLYSTNNPIPTTTLVPTSIPTSIPTAIPTAKPTVVVVPTSIPTVIIPTPTPVPTIIPTTSNYKAEFWNYSSDWLMSFSRLRKPVFTTQVATINFDWGYASPNSRVKADKFMARFTGTQYFEGGQYQFTTTSDDGVRLYVDDKLVIDNWTKHSTEVNNTNVYLLSGNHSIRLEYFEYQSTALIKMEVKKI